MASRPGLKAACNIEHVEELVIRSTTTGRFDYPFARTSYGVGLATRFPHLAEPTSAGLGLSQNSRCTVKAWNGF